MLMHWGGDAYRAGGHVRSAVAARGSHLNVDIARESCIPAHFTGSGVEDSGSGIAQRPVESGAVGGGRSVLGNLRSQGLAAGLASAENRDGVGRSGGRRNAHGAGSHL